MRRAHRVDANQADIVEALRAIGCRVECVNDDFCDLFVGYQGEKFCIEVKDGSKPPSARKLTPRQERIHREWGEYIDVVTSVESAIRLVQHGAGNIRDCQRRFGCIHDCQPAGICLRWYAVADLEPTNA